MRRDELDVVLDWAAAEGWNPGLFDAEAFFDADPNGFFVAECDVGPVGAFSAVAYDELFGFAGLFIVLPEYRGGRCGVELGRRGMAYLGSRTVGLDGVRAKHENYRRLGFAHAYWTSRYRGMAPGDPHSSAGCVAEIENLRDLPIEMISRYDASLFPAPRERFLQTWIGLPCHTALGVIQQDRLVGYGVVRPCRVGFRIGPLMAEESCIAEALLDALLATIPASEFCIDVPEPNESARKMVGRRSMSPILETARMYKGPMPQIELSKVFGVTTLELG